MTTRKYSSRSQQSTLSSGITAGDLSMTVGSGSNLLASVGFSPAGTFTVVIDPDTALEEIVDVTARSGGVLTITRAIDGSSAQAHSAGAVVRHMVIGRDLQDANDHSENTTTAHGATGAVVGTTNTQTLTNKTLTSPTINTPTITTPTISTPNITGTATAVNVTASGTVTAALFSGPLTGAVTGNVTGNLTGNVTGNLTGTVTGGASLAVPLAGGTMTGALTLSGAPSSGLHATTKTYVDLQVSNLVNGATAAYDTLKELGDLIDTGDTAAAALTATVATKANIASPTFTGVPAAPTASVNTNTTQIATTAYVMAASVAPSNLTGPITSVGAATSIASQTGTGTKFVVDTSPTLVTPVLGVATATSINGTTIPSSVTLVKTSDTLATLSATTSAQLAGVISDETGSGSLVFATLPTFGTTGVKLSGSTSGTTTVLSGATAGTSVLTLPVATDTLVGKATTDTLTNKTLTTPVISSITNTGTITLPTSTDTLVGRATTDTLTNKTLTAPLINLAFNAQTGTTYTLVAADSGKLVTSSNAAAIVITIPPSIFAAGEQINVQSIGVGLTSFVAGSGVTVTSTGATSAAPILRVRYSACTIICTASNVFTVIGDLS